MLLLSAPQRPCKIRVFFAHEESRCRSPLPFSIPRSLARARSPGQGPRHLRLRRPPADRRHRPHFRVRLRARLRHSRQGQGPHADLGVLVRADASRSSPTTCSRPIVGRLSRRSPRRARACSPGARCWSRRTEPLPIECVARGYLSGSGWKDYRRHRRGVRHPAARRAARVGPPARSRSSRRRPRRRPGHDINISEARGRRRWWIRPCWRARAT